MQNESQQDIQGEVYSRTITMNAALAVTIHAEVGKAGVSFASHHHLSVGVTSTATPPEFLSSRDHSSLTLFNIFKLLQSK